MTNAPLIFENLGYYFFWFWANYIMGHFSGYFEGASTFLTPSKYPLKGLSHEIDFKTFDKNLQNLA